MAILHRTAKSGDLQRLASLLDQEFIFSKGRKTSLANRFPSTLCASNAGNIFIAEENGEIVSCFLGKRFKWCNAGAIWDGVMIGAVYTHPKRRGEGVGSALLQWGMQVLQEAGMEFAVLWTSQHEFYQKMNWVSADSGVLGSYTPDLAVGEMPHSIKVIPMALCNEREIDDIRSACLDAYVCRQPLDYFQEPIPADAVDLILWKEGRKALAYAVLGRIGIAGIVYEMVGDEALYADLWQAISNRRRKLILNDSSLSETYKWLSANTKVAWENKSLAMWQTFSTDLDISVLSTWYIPYFDRI